MKNLFCLLLFISFCSIGQQKVYRTKVFEKAILSQAESHRLYNALHNPMLDDAKNYTLILEVEYKKIANDFYQFASKNHAKFWQFSEQKMIPIELFTQPNGVIDYFVYGFQGNMTFSRPSIFNDSLTAENEQKLITLAEAFCKSYRLPANLSKNKFRVSFMLNLGDNPKKQSKMYISTIEMAETCDKPDTVKTLMLNNLNLEEFPVVVFKFKNLEKLDLANNYIETIPKAVSAIKNLHFLSISNNPINTNKIKFKKNSHLKDLNLQYTGIAHIPRSLNKNRKLEVLFLGNNRFAGFRKRDFKKLDNLKALNLYNSKLKALPLNITKLPNLEELDLYYNDLKQLPNEICHMPKLKILAVSNNELWSLPENMAKIKTLQTLYAHHNRLNSLPTLPDLKLLHISHNMFKTIPENVYQLTNLIEIDMSKNQIIEVPTQLRKFQKLQRVYFEGNDFARIADKKEELTKLVTDLEKKDILVR